MAFCERILRRHTECMKAFLFDARMHDIQYEPGAYNDHDRCQYTREAYVECRMNPEVAAIAVKQGEKKPTEDYSKPMTQDAVAVAGSSDARGPIPCHQELTMHGKCVENHFRKAMTKGTDYTRAVCFDSRYLFDKCIATHRAIQEGKQLDPTKSGADHMPSSKNKDHFSVSGKH